jgi:putative lipoic acid-binding regulatory protein
MGEHSKPPHINLNEIEGTLEIDYPCCWVYKVIGSDANAMRAAVLQIVETNEVRIEESNTSSTGKFVSLNVEVTVQSDEERTGYYEALKASAAIRMVL